MDKTKLIHEIKQELNLQDDKVTDEVIELYLIEGEKQIKRHLDIEKLTMTLNTVVKKYTIQKMKENNNKYNARVVRSRGLDNFFKDYEYIFQSYKRFLGKTNQTLHQYKKMKNIQKNYAIEQREKKNENN